MRILDNRELLREELPQDALCSNAVALGQLVVSNLLVLEVREEQLSD